MSIFAIALFLHIVGALGVSLALGLEWIGLSKIRRSNSAEEIRTLLGLVKSTSRLGFISMLITVITGIFMVLTAVGWVPWILVVIGALMLAMAIARAFTAPRMIAMGRTLASGQGPALQTIHNLLNDPILWISVQVRVAIVLGIIFLKIAAPGLGGSLLTIGAAIVLGFVSALPMLGPAQAHKASTD